MISVNKLAWSLADQITALSQMEERWMVRITEEEITDLPTYQELIFV